MKEQGHIVIFDDEDIVVKSIRSFLMLETAYDVSPFLFAKEAIIFIRENDLDLEIPDEMVGDPCGGA